MNPSPAPYSLRRRLLLWLMIPLGVAALFALLDSYFNARDTANDAADRVLTGSVLAIADRVYVNEEGKLEVDIPYVALDMLTSAAQDRVFYRIDGPDNAFITGYHQLPVPEPLQTDALPGTVRFGDAVYKQDEVRIAVLQAAASSGLHSIPYRVSVAETTIARQRLTREILLRSAFRQVLLLISTALIVWFAVTRSLRPLEKLEAAIGRRSPDDLRPIRHHVPQEVSGLMLRFNDFMVRLSGAIRAQKNFTGNASHQIRTPLTIIRTHITLASRADSLEEAKQSLASCNNAITDAERTLSQLMLMAQVDEHQSQDFKNASINLSDIARDVTTNLVPEAAKLGFDLGFESDGAFHCHGEAILVGELLRNLIDNAMKHARNGDEITVRVYSQSKSDCMDHDSEDGCVCLEVQDNGVGMPDNAMALTERFRQQDTKQQGWGLGLAIAKEIANLFGGSIRILTPPARVGTLKGALVRVEFRAEKGGSPPSRE